METAIRAWWAQQEEDSRKLADPNQVPPPGTGTVFDVAPVISSHHAIEVVLELEDIVGFKIPDSVVKRGGYLTCDEMVAHLVRKVLEMHQ